MPGASRDHPIETPVRGAHLKVGTTTATHRRQPPHTPRPGLPRPDLPGTDHPSRDPHPRRRPRPPAPVPPDTHTADRLSPPTRRPSPTAPPRTRRPRPALETPDHPLNPTTSPPQPSQDRPTTPAPIGAPTTLRKNRHHTQHHCAAQTASSAHIPPVTDPPAPHRLPRQGEHTAQYS